MTWKLLMTINSFLFHHACKGCEVMPVLNVWMEQGVNRADLKRWAKEYSAPHLLCSQQVQFRSWSLGAWVDWLPESILGKQLVPHKTELGRAVAAAGRGQSVAYSDAVRFLVLYKYGGIYIDADCLILRDLRPLRNVEFVYEWSFEGYPNTAVTGLKKGSAVAAELLTGAVSSSFKRAQQGGAWTFNIDTFAHHFWLHHIYHKLSPAQHVSLVQLPTLLFDPLWLFPGRGVAEVHHAARFDDVFKHAPPPVQLSQRIQDLFKGAFVYHWHGQHKAPRIQDSIMGHVATLYEQYTAGQLRDRAGNFFPGC